MEGFLQRGGAFRERASLAQRRAWIRCSSRGGGRSHATCFPARPAGHKIYGRFRARARVGVDRRNWSVAGAQAVIAGRRDGLVKGELPNVHERFIPYTNSSGVIAWYATR